MCVGNPALRNPRRRPVTIKPVQVKVRRSDWRSEASVRSSDKEIHVVDSETGKASVYHVHEDFISRGARKSAYFENFSQCTEHFQQRELSRTISVRLDHRTSKAFPVFLDYVYESPNFELTTNNVLAVRRIADLFKNIPLMSETWRFIKANMQADNYEHYLREAQHFGDGQTASWVAFGCAKDIHKISPCSDIWRMMSTNDFKRLSGLIFQCRIGHSQHFSEIVAAYIKHHMNEIDEASFKEMTSSKVIPEISAKAAMILMQAEYRIRKETLQAKAQQNMLSSLQKRCMSILKRGGS